MSILMGSGWWVNRRAYFSAFVIAERVGWWLEGTAGVHYHWNQIDSFGDGLQMLIQNGMGVKPRNLNVEYNGYVALALGIGDPFPLNVPL